MHESILFLFAWERLPTLVIVVVLFFLISIYMFRARAGQGRQEDTFIRKISGLSAIDEAIGRATEMGRGVLYIPGIYDMNEIQTVAGINILGQVAGKTAEMGIPLICPVARPFVMSVAQEVDKQAYLEKGSPDAFRPENINYLTYDQFGFAAGAAGQILRENPGACFFMGSFGGEALILSETGNSVGAIQIAGTAEINQIPFFVTSCDYTLIGEELFAASAYLTKNPKEIGCLKGQDASKAIIIAVILLGAIAATFAQPDFLPDGNPLKIIGRSIVMFLGLP